LLASGNLARHSTVLRLLSEPKDLAGSEGAKMRNFDTVAVEVVMKAE
jgi:hypothetical protein